MNILHEKRKLTPYGNPQMGGGGGGGQPERTTQVQDLPSWAKPYAQETLAKGQALTDINQNPYQQYGGERIAGFNPLQNQAFQNAANMQVSPQTGQATNMVTDIANRAAGMGAGYAPARAQFLGVNAPQLQQYQMGPVERVSADTFGRTQAADYMSPFIEQALEPQLRAASRASEQQRQQSQDRAIAAGAFGGGRHAVMEAARRRNLNELQGDIRARGMQSAYEQAANQFNQDAARRMQAGLANQQAGLNVGQQNLAAQLGVQQLGAQTGLQAQTANQQAFQQARQLAEQSRQFGGNLGLQGLQTALQGTGQLGQLGQQQFTQGMDINRLQQQVGGQQQQQQQQLLSQQYQDFLNQQRYPYQQLEFMSNLLRGTPMGTVSSLYSPAASPLAQLAGAGTALYGLGQMTRTGKEGGLMESEDKPAGLAELAYTKI
jgi:hypothetical protein